MLSIGDRCCFANLFALFCEKVPNEPTGCYIRHQRVLNSSTTISQLDAQTCRFREKIDETTSPLQHKIGKIDFLLSVEVQYSRYLATSLHIDH